MSGRLRSPDYPSLSLKQAVDLAKRIYDSEHTTNVDLEVAAKHLGHAALNGTSRLKLASLRKFGLVEYVGASRLRVTGLAERILVPRDEREKAHAVREALERPKVYSWLLSEYRGWRLPSDENLRARLVRDLKFNPNSISGFLDALRESINFAESLAAYDMPDEEGVLTDGEPQVNLGVSARPDIAQANPVSSAGAARSELALDPTLGQPVPANRDFHVLSVPGVMWSVILPNVMSPAEARRMLSWVERVLKPYLQFVADSDENEAPR